MKHNVNYLRTYRKQTEITQADMAFLLHKEDNSNLSRCEKGKRAPSVHMIIVYSLLFNTPVISFFTNQRDLIKQRLIDRIQELIEQLKTEDPTENIISRIDYLQKALIRLTEEKTYEKQQ
ncbi:MAG: hypothetical protein POELPBGB_01413 [Bacteroidia bacterium]|nr:hypothetical protein [Bacteroidia bacterium]